LVSSVFDHVMRSKGTMPVGELRSCLTLGLAVDFRVDLHRHFERPVTEQLSNLFRVRTGSDDVGREGPPQRVNVHVLYAPRLGVVRRGLNAGTLAATKEGAPWCYPWRSVCGERNGGLESTVVALGWSAC
jgi:hypothetical protein